jgi:hypothetical protein
MADLPFHLLISNAPFYNWRDSVPDKIESHLPPLGAIRLGETDRTKEN